MQQELDVFAEFDMLSTTNLTNLSSSNIRWKLFDKTYSSGYENNEIIACSIHIFRFSRIQTST